MCSSENQNFRSSGSNVDQLSDKENKQVHSVPASSSGATPVIAQYIEIKHANPDCLLFYRLGDFFEMFFEDAVIASRDLGIALTKRGKLNGQDIPMAGVPIHAADEYLRRLIALGHKVSVCDQIEDAAEAKTRGAKAIVRREVVRLVTPGTVTEEGLLDGATSNYLAVIAPPVRMRGNQSSCFGLAWMDMSSGEFFVRDVHENDVLDELSRISPKEIVVPEDSFGHRLADDTGAPDDWYWSYYAVSAFDPDSALERLCEFFKVLPPAFEQLSALQCSAGGAALGYVDRTQCKVKPALELPRIYKADQYLSIDAASRESLELVRTLRGEFRGSFLHTVRRTCAPSGHRLFADWIANPLVSREEIYRRQNCVVFFRERPEPLGELRQIAMGIGDVGRALNRLLLGRGGPRDLQVIGLGIVGFSAVARLLTNPEAANAVGVPDYLSELAVHLSVPPIDLSIELGSALLDEAPSVCREGSIIRTGFHAKLDRLRLMRTDGQAAVAALQSRYASSTGIRSLKIKNNNVLGYFIEVRAGSESALIEMPAELGFRHRQTLASVVRFTSSELSEFETEINRAAVECAELERALFDEFVERVRQQKDEIQLAAGSMAVVDCLQALAWVANQFDWTPPKVEDSLAFDIESGRHPVVETSLQTTDETYVANDCNLNGFDETEGRTWLLTGPNMGGKSTFLRQNALIVILAQIGSLVPAKRARIGIVDRLFSRVGASDNLARGQSTFMVEMAETANIVRNATRKSFVILDEVGRGTATYDGLSIAWAVVEHLHGVNQCRSLFATHYHELTGLAEVLPRLHNRSVSARKWKDKLLFLYKVVPGSADRSYGVQVARLAGLPATIVKRARMILDQLESQSRSGIGVSQNIDGLSLFSGPTSEPEEESPQTCALCSRIAKLDPQVLSPREALDELFSLKALANPNDPSDGSIGS